MNPGKRGNHPIILSPFCSGGLSFYVLVRVLARISKMSVQNSNSKNSACPDLAIYQTQILITTSCNSILCWKGSFTLQPCLRRWLVSKIFSYYLLPPKSQNWKFFTETFACPKMSISGNCLSKGQILATSLVLVSTYLIISVFTKMRSLNQGVQEK